MGTKRSPVGSGGEEVIAGILHTGIALGAACLVVGLGFWLAVNLIFDALCRLDVGCEIRLELSKKLLNFFRVKDGERDQKAERNR